jgi:signal transduction histidine kinase
MPSSLDPASRTLRIVGLAGIYLTTFAQLGRALLILGDRASWIWYVALGALYLALFTSVLLRPPRRRWLVHAAMAVECILVLILLARVPEIDFMVALLVPPAFQAAFFFADRTVWIWVAALAVLIAGSLMLFLGPLRGLSLALISIAVEIVLAAFVIVAREIETARRQSQVMLLELETTHRQLQDYAVQAGELATLDERERIARDLNDSVAQTVAGILAATRSARAAVGAGAAARQAVTGDAAAALLAALQAQTQLALAEMRGLIAELRPKAE